MGRFGLDISASGKVFIVGFCDHCYEPSGSTEDFISLEELRKGTFSYFEFLFVISHLGR
jgi:hypothetical protein